MERIHLVLSLFVSIAVAQSVPEWEAREPHGMEPCYFEFVFK